MGILKRIKIFLEKVAKSNKREQRTKPTSQKDADRLQSSSAHYAANSGKEVLTVQNGVKTIEWVKRGWRSIFLDVELILTDSTYKGQPEAIRAMKRLKSYREFDMNGIRRYGVSFSLVTSQPFKSLLMDTMKVRRKTEIESEGNYMNVTDLNSAIFMLNAFSIEEFENIKARFKSEYTEERYNSILTIYEYLFANAE